LFGKLLSPVWFNIRFSVNDRLSPLFILNKKAVKFIVNDSTLFEYTLIQTYFYLVRTYENEIGGKTGLNFSLVSLKDGYGWLRKYPHAQFAEAGIEIRDIKNLTNDSYAGNQSLSHLFFNKPKNWSRGNN